MSTRVGKVSGLSIYPVKSMRGIALQSARVEKLGLENDRRYMVVDEENVFITQRNLPALATIEASIQSDGLSLQNKFGDSQFVENSDQFRESLVTVWQDKVVAQDMGDEVSKWLSRSLEVPCRLVKLNAESRRQIDTDYAGEGEFVSFADGFPILVTNESSLDDLNARMEVPLPMNRFRPNIVVEGFDAWDEDNWKVVKVGSVILRSVKQCGRCRVTTQDQITGVRHGEEPLATLSKFRNVGKKLIFGQNLIPDSEAEIHLGDDVTILS